MEQRVNCQCGSVLELLLFLSFLQGEKDSRLCIWLIFFSFYIWILLKGTLLKVSISPSAFGCVYFPCARWLYGFGHLFLLVFMNLLCPGLHSESLWHPKDSDCPGWCFWIIQMSTCLCCLPSLPTAPPHSWLRVLTFPFFMIKFSEHPGPRLWRLLREDSESTRPVSFWRPHDSVDSPWGKPVSRMAMEEEQRCCLLSVRTSSPLGYSAGLLLLN